MLTCEVPKVKWRCDRKMDSGGRGWFPVNAISHPLPHPATLSDTPLPQTHSVNCMLLAQSYDSPCNCVCVCVCSVRVCVVCTESWSEDKGDECSRGCHHKSGVESNNHEARGSLERGRGFFVLFLLVFLFFLIHCNS